MKMSKARLKVEYLSEGVRCSLARVSVDDCFVGHAITCRWLWHDQTVCWITQLVIYSDCCQCGLAIGMLNVLREHEDTIYGIASSNVAACLAALRAFGDELPTRAFLPS